jgi:hypothetical protein
MAAPPSLANANQGMSVSMEEREFARAMQALDENPDLFHVLCNAIDASDDLIAQKLLPPIRENTRPRGGGLISRVTSRMSSRSRRRRDGATPVVSVAGASAGSPARSTPAAIAEEADELQLVCEELIETERKYGRNLGLVQEHFA